MLLTQFKPDPEAERRALRRYRIVEYGAGVAAFLFLAFYSAYLLYPLFQ